MYKRLLVVAAVVAGALCSSWGQRGVSSAAPSAPVQLGRHNVLSGSETGFARVHLTERAVLDFGAITQIGDRWPRLFRRAGPTPTISVSGTGDFIGMMITRDQPGAPPIAITGQFRSGDTRKAPVVNYSSPILDRYVTLAPGPYRIYLIADAPARVRFSFTEGGEGRARLAATGRAFSDAFSVPATDVGTAAYLYASNEHVIRSDKALAVDLLLVHGGDEVLEGMGLCVHNAEDAVPDVYVGPQCPAYASYHDVMLQGVSGRADTYFMFIEERTLSPGRWTLGGWYAGDAEPDYVGLHTLSISPS